MVEENINKVNEDVELARMNKKEIMDGADPKNLKETFEKKINDRYENTIKELNQSNNHMSRAEYWKEMGDIVVQRKKALDVWDEKEE